MTTTPTSAERQTGAERQRQYRERLMQRLDTAETAIDVLDAIVAWWTEARPRFVTRADAADRDTMAAFVDNEMKSGITWNALAAICKPEAERRDVDCLNTRSKLRAHARYRRDHDGWDVEMDDERVLMTSVGAPVQLRAQPEPREGTMTNRDDTMAGFVDRLMSEPQGITWDALLARSKPETQRRGFSCLNTLGKLRSHAKWRRDHDGWDVEWDDERVRIIRRRFVS